MFSKQCTATEGVGELTNKSRFQFYGDLLKMDRDRLLTKNIFKSFGLRKTELRLLREMRIYRAKMGLKEKVITNKNNFRRDVKELKGFQETDKEYKMLYGRTEERIQ